jgi:Sec-independent protein secretion pathway component TatC
MSAVGLSGPTWAELVFLFSREFLIAFLFIFPRVFQFKFKSVSNSNKIKHVQQFKEYLGFNMMQHFMTHLFCQK